MAAEGNGDLPVPDLRTMEELCKPYLNGRGGLIAPIAIQATNFGLKNDMIQQVQNSCQFHGLPGDDANKHLDKFLHVTQSIKVNGVTNDVLRLYLFPHSLTHHATTWFDRLLRNLINAFEQMAKMFLEKYFPPSMVTKLINEITNLHQRLDESLFKAWEAQQSESSSSITSSFDTKITALKAEMAKINKNLMRVLQVNQQVKAVTPRCETYGGPHSFSDCPATVSNTQNVYAVGAYQAYQAPAYQASVHQPQIPQPQVMTTNKFTNFMKENDAILKNMQTNITSLTNSNLELKNMFGQFIKMNTASSSGSGTLPDNVITNPKEDLKGITTRSGTTYQGPTISTTSSSLPPVVERETEATKDTVLLKNKDKLSKLARTPLNKHFSAVLLKKLPEKLGDPGKFLILCDFPRMAECIALADLEASINLMPLFVWNKLSLPILSPTCMTLQLVDRLISRPIRVAEVVFVKVGTFHFLADFVVVDFDADPRVPLILGRSFLKTERALIDVFKEVDAFQALEDDPTSPKVDQSYEIMPQVRKEPKICEAKIDKSSIDEPPKVELKDLPPHLEYAFLEGNDKLPVIIAKDLSVEEKTALIT
nr:reverse transcriptase domain-containing protein [Tanacetum cinerariifolium]